ATAPVGVDRQGADVRGPCLLSRAAAGQIVYHHVRYCPPGSGCSVGENTMRITSTRRLLMAGTGVLGSAMALAACVGDRNEPRRQDRVVEPGAQTPRTMPLCRRPPGHACPTTMCPRAVPSPRRS